MNTTNIPVNNIPVNNTHNNNDMILRARKYGYEEVLHIIQFLLKECAKAPSEDQRTKSVQKIFAILNRDPLILVFEPAFRLSVIMKINELEQHIHNRNQAVIRARYDEVLVMMKKSIYLNVCNHTMRNTAIKHLNIVSRTLNKYARWNMRASLINEFNMLKQTMENIKTHPCYRQG